MTDVGKMIYNEGIGKGKAELLISQLIKKFKNVPEDYKKKIMELPEDIVEVIGTDIFDMKSVDELRRYFN